MKKKKITSKLNFILTFVLLFPFTFNILNHLMYKDTEIALAQTSESYGKEFYVAPNGNDSNNGDINAPFATLEKAKNAINDLKLKPGLPERGIVVYLRGGVYNIDSTFSLNKKDSGESGKPIVYSAYKNENVRLIGGKILKNSDFKLLTSDSPIWSKIDTSAKGKIYQMDLKAAGITDFSILSNRNSSRNDNSALELYCNSKPMQLARYPDINETQGDNIKKGFIYIKNKTSDTSFTVADDRIKNWTSEKDVWTHGLFFHLWSDSHIKISNIDTKSNEIELADIPPYGIKEGNPFYVENLLEEVTTPGEWYLDREAGILYFWPSEDICNSEISVSILKAPLIELKNTSNIILKNITFEIGRSTLVKINGGDENSLQNCIVRNSGSSGIQVAGGTNNGITDSQIYDTENEAISINGGVRFTLSSCNNFVTNCDIHNFGKWVWCYKPGINVSGVGVKISHNNIHDAPHAAILFGGNNNILEYNNIYNVCQYSDDAGAIYGGRRWDYRGNIIQYNFIHDISSNFGKDKYRTNGIYLDDCLSGNTVFGNILYNIAGIGVQMGGGRDTVVENNIMVNCKYGVAVDNRGIKSIVNKPGDSWNLLEKANSDNVKRHEGIWKTTYPELDAIPDDWNTVSDQKNNWLQPEGCVLSRNIGYKNTLWINKLPVVFSKYKEMKDNIENQDPLFLDEANLDLTLKIDSPAYKIPGFKEIPFSKIGINKDGSTKQSTTY